MVYDEKKIFFEFSVSFVKMEMENYYPLMVNQKLSDHQSKMFKSLSSVK